MTTYLTDYFVQCLNDEFDMHESDGDLKEYWGYFCMPGTAEDEFPNWEVGCVRDWAEDILENNSGFSKLGDNLCEAIKRDVDCFHILTCIKKAHTDWYVAPESEKEEEAEAEAEAEAEDSE